MTPLEKFVAFLHRSRNAKGDAVVFFWKPKDDDWLGLTFDDLRAVNTRLEEAEEKILVLEGAIEHYKDKTTVRF